MFGLDSSRFIGNTNIFINEAVFVLLLRCHFMLNAVNYLQPNLNLTIYYILFIHKRKR